MALNLETEFLDAARRRSISAGYEARLHGIELKTARAIIRKLLRAKLIYASSRGKPNYWGGTETDYRAN
jgi:hypothetical protein